MIAMRFVAALAAVFTIAACGPNGAVAATDTVEPAREAAARVPGPAATPVAVPTAVAAAAAPAALPAAGDTPSIDRTNRTGAAVLHDILVKAGQIDGARITDFQLTGRCKTTFSSAGGTTTIDWSKVGNFAGHDLAGRTILDVDDGSGSHAISVPSGTLPEPLGNASARVNGGLSVIADSCAG